MRRDIAQRQQLCQQQQNEDKERSTRWEEEKQQPEEPDRSEEWNRDKVPEKKPKR